MLDELDEQPVERVRRDARELTAHEERLDVRDDLPNPFDAQEAALVQVVGGHQHWVTRLCAPASEP